MDAFLIILTRVVVGKVATGISVIQPHLLWIATRILHLVNDPTNPRAHVWLFGLTVGIYWLIYDRMEHSYISRIYQRDKYGIVIVYILLNMLSFQNDWNAMYGKCDPCDNELDKWYTVSTIVKMLLFVFIFKNNTSEDKVQAVIHTVFAGLLGIFSLIQRQAFLQQGAEFNEHLVLMLVYSVLFQCFGYLADATSPSISLNKLIVGRWYGRIAFSLCWSFTRHTISAYLPFISPNESYWASTWWSRVLAIAIDYGTIVAVAKVDLGPSSSWRRLLNFATMTFEVLAIQLTL